MYNLDDILNDIESQLPTLREDKFIKNFLPFFIGKIDPKLIPTAVSAWVNGVAGNATTPVNIIDPNGKVLFTVPPLLNLSRVEITDSNHFAYVSAHRQTHIKNNPEISEAVMTKEINSAVETSMIIHEDNTWESILRRYNLLAENKPVVEDTTGSVLSDLGIY